MAKNDQNNPEISAAELLEKLRRNLEIEDVEPEIDIPLPDEPSLVNEEIEDAEEIIHLRSLVKNNMEPATKPADEPLVLDVVEEPEVDNISFTLDEEPQEDTPVEDDLSFALDQVEEPEEIDDNGIIFDSENENQEVAEADLELMNELDTDTAEEPEQEYAEVEDAEEVEEVEEIEETQLEEIEPEEEIDIDAQLESMLESNTSGQPIEDEFPDDEDMSEPEDVEEEAEEPEEAVEVEPVVEKPIVKIPLEEEQQEYPQAEFSFTAAQEIVPAQEEKEVEVPEQPDYSQQTFFEDARSPIVPDIQEAFEDETPQDHNTSEEITKAVFGATSEVDMTEEPVIEEPQDDAFERAMDDLFGTVDKTPTSSTQEIISEINSLTSEYETSPTTDEAIAEMMANFLAQNKDDIETTTAEDDAFAQVFGEGPDGNAEEYISAIEEAIEAEEPKEAVSETEKAIQDIGLDEIDYGEDFDEVDVNLMIAFGMEDELAEKIGDDHAENVKDALDADADNLDLSRSKKKKATTELPDDMEFRSQNQVKDVFKVYKRKQRNVMIRFFGALIFTIVLFIFENFEVFGGKWANFLDPKVFPTVHSMISLQLLFFVLAFAIKDLLSGFKSLFTFKPTHKSIISIMTLFTIVYHIGIGFLYNEEITTIYATFPLALSVILTIAVEYLTLRRDLYSFNIVSSKRMKYVISEIPEEEDAIEREAFAEYVDEEDAISRISKTNFINGFFSRTKKNDKPIPALRAIIPIPIAIAVLFFVFSVVVKKNIFLGWTSAYMALMISTPIAAISAVAIPFTRASKAAYNNGGAIIGDEALEEYSNVAAISFDDKDVFPSNSIKLQSIKVFNNNRIDRVIFNVASLYKYLGGPLGDVYNVATKDIECSDDVELVDVQDDGIEAVISGKRIFLGRRAYIIRNGFAPVYDSNDRKLEDEGDSVITFLVTNDQVAAKIYTHYSLEATFPTIVKQLYKAGMCMGIKTFDPGIDDDMLGHMIDLSKYPVKVIKCRSKNDTIRSTENAESGIVSKKNARSLLKTLSLCDRVNSAIKTNMIVLLLSSIIGFVISGFTLLHASATASSGLLIALYQLFWIVPTFLVSLIDIKNK